MREADVILVSNAVFTGREDAPRRLAVAIGGDRILWVGKPEDTSAWKGAHTDVRDFGDALVMPGFHDGHIHFFHSALYNSPLAERFMGENEADCVARLAPLATRRPQDGWLLAQGWREYRWNPPGMPSKASLDAVFPDRPVALYSGDAHTLWLNSRALERLGIHRDSEPPEGGYYKRDETGELTGVVGEVAAMQLMPRIVSEFSAEELVDAYRSFERKLNSEGVTAVCDVSLMAMPGLDFVRDDLYFALEEAGELTVRAHMFPTLLEDTSRLFALREACEAHGPMVAAPGFKQFFDGVSSMHTAWIHDPYTNAHFEGDCGTPLCEPDRMHRLVMEAARLGEPVRIHAIGDEAIHTILDILEDARKTYGPLPSGRRNCVEHLENFQPDDIKRLAELDVVASVQPRHITLDPGGPERDLGDERVPYMWPFATLLREGTTLAFGTDSPVTATNPLDGIYMAMTRKDADTHLPEGGWLPDERITLAQALRAYTAGSAASASRLHELGTLEAGKFADVVVLDGNPFATRASDSCALQPDVLEAQAEAVQNSRIQATYVAGRCVYEG